MVDDVTKRTERLKAHFAMLLFSAIIAGSFSLGHLAAPHIDPSALNAIRFAIATVVLFVVGLIVTKKAPLNFNAPWRFLILGGLTAIYFVTMFMALRISKPISTSAVFTLIPLMTAGFGAVILKQRVSMKLLAGLLIAAMGALWVIFGGQVERLLAFRIGAGEAIFFVGCFAYAFYPVMVRKFNKNESPFAFTVMTLFACAIILSMVGLPELLSTQWSALPQIVWVAIGFLSIFATACTFFILQYASLRLPAAKVFAYGYLTPCFVIIYEGLLGHGWASFSVFLGGVITALALVYTLISQEQSAA